MVINELIYCIFFLLVFGAKAVGLNEGHPFFNACIAAGILLFILKLFSTRTTLFEYIINAAILLSGGLTYIYSGEKGLLLYFTLMLGMKAVNEKRVMKMARIFLGTAFFILFLLSVSGIIEELNHMYKKSGYGFLLRHSLGYPYPNTTHTTLLILIILFFYLYRTETVKKLIIASLFAMLINVYLYIYTVSMTGLLSVTIYLFVNFYLQVRKDRSHLENILIGILFPFTVVFSITGPLLAKGEVFDFMNKLLHKRYEYALYYLQTEKIMPFGSRFAPAPTRWYMIDNSFLYLFLQLGVVSFLIVFILYTTWIVYLLKKDKRPELAIIITFCFIGMSDPFLFNLSVKNITFVFMGVWLYAELGKIAEKLPPFFQRNILILPFGEMELPLPFQNKKPLISSVKERLLTDAASHVARNLTAFLIAAGFAFAIYQVSVPIPSRLYVDAQIVDPYFGHSSVEMTQDDVEEAIAAGNLVEGYDPAEPTMYVFKKKASRTEYYRGMLTSGVLSGLLVIIVLTAISTTKSPRPE